MLRGIWGVECWKFRSEEEHGRAGRSWPASNACEQVHAARGPCANALSDRSSCPRATPPSRRQDHNPTYPIISMSSYSHARTASDIQTSVLLGLPEQSLNPPPSPSLDSHGFSLIQGDAPEQPPREVWERKLGSNEVSYYLPSRAEGVNDMYVVSLQTCRERRTEGRDQWALRPRVQGSPGRVRARKEGRDGHPSNARPLLPLALPLSRFGSGAVQSSLCCCLSRPSVQCADGPSLLPSSRRAHVKP